MKLANGLSLLRVFLTPPLLVLLLWCPPSGFLGATLLFFIASWSDVLDGYFARRRSAVSKLGVFIDLVADKTLTSAVLVAFVDLDLVPAWTAIAIIAREFLITGFRTLAAAEGVVIPAAGWGKRKTAVTNLAIGGMILRADFQRGGATADYGLLESLFGLAPWLYYLAVVLTVWSGLRYLWGGRELVRRLAV